MRKQTDDGTVFCESVAIYMKSLLEKRDFAGAISYYESNRSLVAKVGGLWAGAMMHLAAQGYASLTKYSAALKTARTAQAIVATEADSILLAEIFITLGGILRDCGELREAHKSYCDAESIFRRNDSPEGQSRALNQMAGLYFRQNDYRNALAVLMDAVVIAKKLGDNKKLAFMMGNVGRLQTFLGDFAQAEHHLQFNIELSSELGDEIEIVRARLSLGYVYLQKAEYDRAQVEFDQAYPLIVALKATREEVIYNTYLGELLYKCEHFEESHKILTAGLAAAEAIAPGSSLAGRVMRHLAELYLLSGDNRQAQRLAARSMVIMKKAKDQVELGALYKIKAQLAAAAPKPAKAREMFTRAIDILDESGVRWEMAQALVAAGSSAVYSDRQRLTYLFRAEDFYTRSGLKGKLDEISRMIGSVESFDRSAPAAAVMSGDDVDYLTRCPEILRFKEQLPLLGRADLPLLITGETGVGKDHLAKYFHSLVRPQAPFVAINCASVPDTLLESELFGYRQGAFTGAVGDKTGLFVAANGGVLLLDEIGDMPLALQAKLLGALETRKVTPLGGTAEVDIKVILVATTNQNLEEMVERGTFRRDLYYRLSGFTFQLPPLRKRKEDIGPLLEHFMARFNLLGGERQLPTSLLRQFIDYDWPGNIRELVNKVRRLDVMSQMVVEGDLVEVARTIFAADQVAAQTGLFDRVAQFERQLISEALLATNGNKSEAARLLGVHEATVRTKLKRYGIITAVEHPVDIQQEGGAPN